MEDWQEPIRRNKEDTEVGDVEEGIQGGNKARGRGAAGWLEHGKGQLVVFAHGSRTAMGPPWQEVEPR